jgi:putative Mg2+ transporter-C (MgtC) family protein
MSDWHYVFWDLFRLVIAAVISGAIGFEREAHGQAAGLRTYILVGVGACLMMMLSLEMVVLHRHLSAQSVVRLDPARIASYAIAGMGFLGAGAIITGKGTVRGLTTAAALWLVTAVGLAIGAGYLIPAIIATLVSLVILYGLRQLKPVLMLRDEHTILTLKYDRQAKPLPRIRKILSDHQMAIHFINYKVEIPANVTTYRLRLQSKDDRPWGNVVKHISETQGLKEIAWQEGEVP